jgi:hypothetical protein
MIAAAEIPIKLHRSYQHDVALPDYLVSALISTASSIGFVFRFSRLQVNDCHSA